MAKIADLIVSLSADIASFRSGMEEANSYLADTRAQAQAANDTLSELTRVVEAVVSVETVDRLSDFVSSLAAAGSQIGNTARELGMGAEEFQALSFVAQQAGSSQEAFRAGMDHLAKSVSAFASGASGPASDAFRKLQISVFDAQGGILPLDEILPQIATKLEGVSSSTQRLALEQDIFGRGGAQLDQTLQALANQGVDQLTAKMTAAGLVLGGDTIKSAQELDNEFRDLSTVIKNQMIQSVVALGPELTELTKELMGAAQGVGVLLNGAGSSGVLGGKTQEQLQESIDRVTQLRDLAAAGLTGNPENWDQSKVDLVQQYNDQIAELEARKAATPATTAPAAPGGSSTPGPFVDPAAQKQLADFQSEYKELLDSYGTDLDYQNRLRDAYQEGGTAVAQLTAQHAGEAAVEKMLADAQKAGVQVTAEQVQSTYDLAYADEEAKTAADEQKQATDALASQQRAYQQQLQSVLDASDGLSKKNNDLANSLGILEQQVANGSMSLTEYQTRATALQASMSGMSGPDAAAKQAAEQVSSAVERGASSFLDASVNALTAKNAFEGFAEAARGLAADLLKAAEQTLILDPILNALGLGKNSKGGRSSSAAPGASSGQSAGSATAGSTAAGAGSALTTGIKDDLSSAGKSLDGAFTGLENSFSKIFSSASSDMSEIFSDLESDFETVFDDFGSIFENIADYVGGAASGVGSTISSVFSSIGSFLGFAGGGSFDVGGTGSPDSKLVAFMATPGEHVQVGDYGSSPRGGVNVNIVNNHPGAQVTQQSQKNANGGTDIVVQIEDAMAARYRRGQGNMRRAIEQSHSLSQVPIKR